METLAVPTEEYEITMREFLANSSKYFDYAKKTPVSINNDKGEKFTIIYDIEDDDEEGDCLMATAEDIEDFRRGREEMERGEYFEQLPGETMAEFAERIIADPEKWMACNMK